MKEIQQALISLGPLIAGSIFSLRAKEQGDVFEMGSLDYDQTSNTEPVDSSEMMTFGIKEEVQNTFFEYEDSERNKGLHCTKDTEPVNSSEIITFGIKEEVDHTSFEYGDSERKESLHCTKGFPLINMELEATVREHHSADEGESGFGTSSGTRRLRKRRKEPVDLDLWQLPTTPVDRSKPKRRRFLPSGRDRIRQPKFTEDELTVLANEVVKYADYLFGSLMTSIPPSRRTALWGRITQRINAVAFTPRTVSDVKKRWQDLKGRVRGVRTAHCHAVEAKSGGKVPDPVFTPWEEVAASVIDVTTVAGEGDNETYRHHRLSQTQHPEMMTKAIKDSEGQMGHHQPFATFPCSSAPGPTDIGPRGHAYPTEITSATMFSHNTTVDSTQPEPSSSLDDDHELLNVSMQWTST